MQGQGFTMNEVDRFYLAVIHAADEKKIPVLGICKGIQAINVAYKGTLYQDLKTQKASADSICCPALAFCVFRS